MDLMEISQPRELLKQLSKKVENFLSVKWRRAVDRQKAEAVWIVPNDHVEQWDSRDPMTDSLTSFHLHIQVGAQRIRYINFLIRVVKDGGFGSCRHRKKENGCSCHSRLSLNSFVDILILQNREEEVDYVHILPVHTQKPVYINFALSSVIHILCIIPILFACLMNRVHF